MLPQGLLPQLCNADLCTAARQKLGADVVKLQTVLVPQREGFGLCWAVPSALLADALSEADHGRKADFLVPSHEDIDGDTSRIGNYSLFNSTSTSTALPTSSLAMCSGVQLGVATNPQQNQSACTRKCRSLADSSWCRGGMTHAQLLV